MFKDAYDLEVTCASDAALQAYVAGIDASLCFDRPGIDEFREAIVEDDDFALAHAALGRQLFIHGFASDAKEHFAKALTRCERVTSRERSTVKVCAAAFNSGVRSLATVKAHVAEYPNDVFVLAHLLGPFGMLAFSGMPDWHAENVALLDATKSYYRDDDWWHLSARAFVDAELGNLIKARHDAERAWSINENGNCAHSLAHLHFEAGVLEEGRQFLGEWAANQGTSSNMRHHLVWHLSFLELESGVDMQQIMERYDLDLDPRINDPNPLETLCDNASFLWRSKMAGVDISTTIREELLQYANGHFRHRGFAFADLHVAMATALSTDSEIHPKFVACLAEDTVDSELRAANCVLQFAHGLEMFVSGAYTESVTILESAMADSIRLGGSNPQRRIIEDTYIEACIRAGEFDKAGAKLLGRKRRNSVFDQRLLEKTGVEPTRTH